MIKIAILDMYDGVENLGMNCIKNLISKWKTTSNTKVSIDIFDIRKNNIPNINYDIFISTGGPGSPIVTDLDWEKSYYKLLSNIISYNSNNDIKKYVLFICHSFQIACQFFKIGNIRKNENTIIGVYPLKKIKSDIFLENLNNTFFVMDNRDYRVDINCENDNVLAMSGDSIMCIKFNNEMIGTQFHPEATVDGVRSLLNKEDKKILIENIVGEDGWKKMVTELEDPNNIENTYNKFIFNYLNICKEMIIT